MQLDELKYGRILIVYSLVAAILELTGLLQPYLFGFVDFVSQIHRFVRDNGMHGAHL